MSDDDLLNELAAALAGQDEPPAELFQRGRDAFLFRNLDAELADMVADSLVSPVPVRADAGPRSLSFEADGLTIELDVTTDHDERRILGSVSPPQTVAVEIPGRLTDLAVDDHGRFHVTVPTGPVRLHISGPAITDHVTSWVVV